MTLISRVLRPSSTMPTDQSAFRLFHERTRFGSLDALRAISVLAVLWQHVSGRPGPALSQNGYLGVQFFFAISGFLITTLLLREHSRTGGISLRRFYARRSLRIFPLYYATLLAYVLLIVLGLTSAAQAASFIAHLPAFLTYTTNWFVSSTGSSVPFYFAWSLATEEQFYLLWPPLLVLLLSRARGRRLALPVLLGVAAAAEIALLVGDQSVLWIHIVARLSVPIILGAALALLLDRPRTFAPVAAILGRRWSAPVVFGALALVLCFPVRPELPEVLMVLAVGTVVIREDTPLSPFLRWRPLVFVGTISYGVYLLHMLAANVVRMVLHQHASPVLFALTVPTVVVVAWLSFRYFEGPLLRLKRRYASTPEQSRGASSPAEIPPARAGVIRRRTEVIGASLPLREHRRPGPVGD